MSPPPYYIFTGDFKVKDFTIDNDIQLGRFELDLERLNLKISSYYVGICRNVSLEVSFKHKSRRTRNRFLLEITDDHWRAIGTIHIDLELEMLTESGDKVLWRIPPWDNICLSASNPMKRVMSRDLDDFSKDRHLRYILTVTGNGDEPNKEEGKHCIDAALGKILGDSNLADFKVECEGEIFECHRMVLAARSDVFRAMFECKESKEWKTGSMEIVDVEKDTVKAMLGYIYTDKVRGEI